MRGERDIGQPSHVPYCGSSPHARGTLHKPGLAVLCLRFIPACAGNAAQAGARRSLSPVHPRVRRERCAARAAPCNESGSSPHARGTRYFPGLFALILRFIPACAGNASMECLSKSAMTVHPRMRGERDHCLPDWRHNHGSSPHARGTRTQANPSRRRRRFIPACAGNAITWFQGKGYHAVHPRMRGERR